MARVVSALVLLLASAALVACGGDDGGGGGDGGERLSAEEYRQQARRICEDAERATEQVEEPTRATPEAIVDYFGRLLEANEGSTERFSELEPPEDLEQAHQDALDANRQGIEEVRRLIEQLEEGGDPREVLGEAQGRLEDLSRRSVDAAERLGIPECADQ